MLSVEGKAYEQLSYETIFIIIIIIGLMIIMRTNFDEFYYLKKKI